MENDDSNESDASFPQEPTRVKAFANFFKRYMSISSVVAAALPIPVTAINLIPTYSAQTELLSTYTPMICFLMLGYLFFMRHRIGMGMFGVALEQFRFQQKRSHPRDDDESTLINRAHENRLRVMRRRAFIIDSLPLLLIVLTIGSIFTYHMIYDRSVNRVESDKVLFGTVREKVAEEMVKEGIEDSENYTASINPSLINHNSVIDGIPKYLSLSKIPEGYILMILYIFIFVFAEAAFILMAIKEYLQDLLRLSDTTLLVSDKNASYEQIASTLNEDVYRKIERRP